MRDDVRTVMWKERKCLFRFRGSRVRFLLTLLFPFLFAVFQPLRDGPSFVENEGAVVFSAIIPVIVLLITIPDSFAGERERKTLETLLVSRLPDRAILFGKLVVSVAFAWGLALLVLLLSLVTVNIAHWDGTLLLYKPTIALASLGMSFLMATLAAGAGVLVSLRAATVQEAAQTLAAIFLVPPMLFNVVLLLFVDRLRDLVGGLKGEHILLFIAIVLGVIDAAVYAATLLRFQRSRLILD